jgi:hypothetical protein
MQELRPEMAIVATAGVHAAVTRVRHEFLRVRGEHADVGACAGMFICQNQLLSP